MRYVAAYMLAVQGGNKSPTEEDIRRILASVDAPCDADLAKKVVSELSGKNLDELITSGRQVLENMPAGGGGGAAAPAATGQEPAKEDKKEEKKEEEEEEDEDMGFSLFD